MVGLLPVCSSVDEVKEEGSGEGEKLLACRFRCSMSMPLKRDVRVTKDLERREKQISAFHEGMKVVLRPLPEFDLKRSVVGTRVVVNWKCVPLLMSYYF